VKRELVEAVVVELALIDDQANLLRLGRLGLGRVLRLVAAQLEASRWSSTQEGRDHGGDGPEGQ